MMKKVISDRNILLILAVVLAFVFPNIAKQIKESTFWILAIVMMFSLTGISLKALYPLKKIVKPMLTGILLNHFVYGVLIISIAYLFVDKNLFIGFIIIAATPPGVAIIPFTAKMKGNLEYAIIGTFGAFVASVFLSPIILEFFIKDSNVSSFKLLNVMFMLIVIPFILSRTLLVKQIKPYTEKYRGSVVDIGFAIIIFTSVGINAHVFYKDIDVLLKVSLSLLVVMFGGVYLIKLLLKKNKDFKDIISYQLLFAVKSSGFAVVTAMEVFGDKTAVPATVLSVITLVFLLTMIIIPNNAGLISK